MKREELEAAANDLEKSLNPEGGEKKSEEPTMNQLFGKALDLVSRVLPARLSKAFAMPPPGGDEDEEEEKKKKMMGGGMPPQMPPMGMGKSGETHQPHGDQNTLNTGEMSSKKKIPKKFNYDAKMEDTGVDYPANSEVDYEPYKERHEVHKSFDEIQNDPDLSDEDKVFVVNQWLEKGFGQIDQMQKSLEVVTYTQGVLLKAMKHFVDLSAQQGNQGRGRISHLNVVDKSLGQQRSSNGDQPQLNRMEISTRLLKAQKAGKIDYQSVALAEACMNGDPMTGTPPSMPPPHIMAVISE